MAEKGVGGSGGDEENPFSFKNFVSGKAKKAPQNAGEALKNRNIVADDILNLNEDLNIKTDKSKVEGLLTSASQKTPGKKDKQRENPFSFKKFLSSGSASSSKRSSSSVSTSLNLGDDVPFLPLDTPQAIKNHSNGLNLRGTERKGVLDSLPVEAIDCDLLANSLDASSYPGDKVSLDRPIYFHDSDDEDGEDVRGLKDNAGNIPLALPDFLSDAGALSSRPTLVVDVDSKSEGNRDDLLDQIRILQEENDRLRSELGWERQRSSDQTQKLSQLKIDLERQKKKEAEETAILEKAVHQVEENLVTTTKRAVQAEATISKLTKEVKSLQNQVQALRAENEAYKMGDGGLSDLHERTKYSSEQLASAAVVAEKNLKELMAGVDKLKLLSQVLASLDKIQNASSESAAQDDTKPS